MKTLIATEFHVVPAAASGDEDVMVQCPTCNIKLKCVDMAEHCRIELERLQQENASTSTPTVKEEEAIAANSNTSGSITGRNGASSSSSNNEERRKPWSVFQRIQRNRQARQRQRARKRTATPTPPPPPPTDFTCPVCNQNFPQSEIQRHANQCLRRNKSNGATSATGNDSSDEDDESEEYEEYEWAGQKRIRVSTMVPGGYATLGIGQSIKYNGSQQLSNNNGGGDNNDDEEEDLNVDEDDTHIYGPAQYGEADVIPLASDDSDDPGGTNTSYMRRLIASGDVSHGAQTNEDKNSQLLPQAAIVNTAATAEASTDSNEIQSCDPEAASTSATSAMLTTKESKKSTAKNAAPSQQIIESLKAKLRLYESQIQNKYKCLICIDDYKNPAISVSCWHVYCEQCWLRTLGARKLCPQCNSITTPKDLRRIYL